MNPFNRTKGIIRPLVVALAVGVMPAAAISAPSASAAPSCGIFWGSLAKSSDRMPASAITNVRAGRHACFDRMVVDINGKHADIVGGHAGYFVRYVRDVFEDPRGRLVALRGGAKLQVAVRAHTEDIDTGVQVFRPSNPRELVNVGGFSTFRQIKLIGPSFEGVTQIGLGVRARLPFRVFTLDGPGAGSRLVIDVAHHW